MHWTIFSMQVMISSGGFLSITVLLFTVCVRQSNDVCSPLPAATNILTLCNPFHPPMFSPRSMLVLAFYSENNDLMSTHIVERNSIVLIVLEKIRPLKIFIFCTMLIWTYYLTASPASLWLGLTGVFSPVSAGLACSGL